MSLTFLDNLLESATENPEIASAAILTTTAVLAATAYLTCFNRSAKTMTTEEKAKRLHDAGLRSQGITPDNDPLLRRAAPSK
ncbi:hypothetical protein [Candidatus Berkiella aquae]|uniref:Uncharacterized protein n=1 Tax=Candidatus Berkiella aquae TaxID=295108 RepID=A0A0Q9YU99_9GAMM|nr:hypothetical protein [Candidatus Berkiella aquae]MCS5710012.1 hypothetical protein [Candidatus Berkiella aquae]